MGKPVIPTDNGTWSIGGDDGGTFNVVQDLNDMIGLNLNRDVKKAINGRHCAVEFGFKSIFEGVNPRNDIVSPVDVTSERGDTIKITSGAFSYTGTVHQISIHRIGQFARITLRKNTLK